MATRSKKKPVPQNNGSIDDLYRPEYAAQAKQYCSQGATLSELAVLFGVQPQIIRLWMVTHPEFAEACKIDSDAAHNRAERSVYERAVGYDYIEEKLVTVRGKPQLININKHIPPNVDAGKFWITNRRPTKWANKPDPEWENEQLFAEVCKQFAGTTFRPKE